MYLINFQNIYYAFKYQKTLLRTLLLLVFKIVETFSFIQSWFFRSSSFQTFRETFCHPSMNKFLDSFFRLWVTYIFLYQKQGSLLGLVIIIIVT